MVVDFTTSRRPDENVRLLKGSDREKFSKSLNDLFAQGFVIIIFNMAIKVVPRIGKVVTYFAELKILNTNYVAPCFNGCMLKYDIILRVYLNNPKEDTLV